MAKCLLGPKKLRRIEALTGRRVNHAKVRGGWEHFWAETFFCDGSVAQVNYKTGEMEPIVGFYQDPWWGDRPAPEGCAVKEVGNG